MVDATQALASHAVPNDPPELSPFAEALIALAVEGLGVTKAESDVTMRVLLGETTAAIAQARGVVEGTVEVQLQSIYRRTDLFGRKELRTYALLWTLSICESLLADYGRAKRDR